VEIWRLSVYPKEARQEWELAQYFGSNFTHSLILKNENQAPQFIGERVEHFGAKLWKFKIKLSNEKVSCGVMLSMFGSHLPC